MRLWHKDLIPYLPQQWLLAQWRECCAIASCLAKDHTPNHLLVNPVTDYDPAVESPVPKPIERGTELVPLGRLETKDEYLLDILKENGFYLMYQKRDSKFGEFEYYQVLYPIA